VTITPKDMQLARRIRGGKIKLLVKLRGGLCIVYPGRIAYGLARGMVIVASLKAVYQGMGR